MELLTGIDYLGVIKYRAFKIPSKKQLPSLQGILNNKANYVQLMKKILPLVYNVKHS